MANVQIGQAEVPAPNDSPATASFKYHAFIAYSHKDEGWAKWLQRALETYRVPERLVGTTTAVGPVQRRLTPIFRDRSELPSAADLTRVIREALEESANLIVICSPSSAASSYVNEEISTFQMLGRADRIFCLIVEGEPNASQVAGRAPDECFAPALRLQALAGGLPTRQHVAPIAADVRPHKDGRTNAKLKLIAGIIGVGFDALKQREHQRHVRRMAAITVLALVVMLITTGLAIEAAIARRTAESARQAAERRQKQAENLVEFMLGDLHDKLNQVQRLDILEATNNEAMKYFQSLPTNDVTDQALALRVKALQHIGSIRTSQGKLPAALEAYWAALALARELAQRAPADSTRQVAYANCFNWIGNAYWFQGDLDRSLQNFQKAIGLLEKEVSARPADADLAASLASARTNAGRVYEARGEYEAAKKLYELVQVTFESLVTRNPASTRWQSELGYAYDNLGKVALEQGQLAQAIEAYRADQRIKAALAAQDPKNYDAQEALLVADAILGRALALRGATKESLHYVREAVSISRTLVVFDPTQAYWREDLASYGRLLSSILRQNGELDEATRLNAEALETLEELVAKDRTNVRWLGELGLAQVESARQRLARHDYGGAGQQAAHALATSKAGRAVTPNDVDLIVLAADANIVAGQIAAKRADAIAAHDYWVQARDTIAPLGHTGDPNVLAVYASSLILLNNPDAARPPLQRLGAMGYRTTDFNALLIEKKVPYSAGANSAARPTHASSMDVQNQSE